MAAWKKMNRYEIGSDSFSIEIKAATRRQGNGIYHVHKAVRKMG